LEGNRQTRCSADGTWSSEPVTCTILTCNDPEVEIANSQSVGDCSSVTYGSSCSLNCSSDYIVSGNGEHVCDDVNDEGTSVKWRSVGGEFACVAACKCHLCIVSLILLYYVANGDSGVVGAAIVGAIGGVIGLIFFIMLCIVVLVVRQFHKDSYPTDKKNDNGELKFPHCKHIKIPMLTKVTSSTKVPLQPDPSFRLSRYAKPNRKIINDHYGYAKPSKFVKEPVKHVHDYVNVKAKDNPSYCHHYAKNMIKVDDPSWLHHTDDVVHTEDVVQTENDPAYHPHNSNTVRREVDPGCGLHYNVRPEDDPAYGICYINSNTVRVEEDPTYLPHHTKSNTIRLHHTESNTVRVEVDSAYVLHHTNKNYVTVENDPAYCSRNVNNIEDERINYTRNTVQVENDPSHCLCHLQSLK